LSTGQHVQWAQRGYIRTIARCPAISDHRLRSAERADPARAERPGNVHDGKAALGFLRALFQQLAATLNGHRLEFRMDGAFFRRDIIELVEHHGAEYAIKVPFYPWSGSRRRSSRPTAGSGWMRQSAAAIITWR